jgi:hypothetical protein
MTSIRRRTSTILLAALAAIAAVVCLFALRAAPARASTTQLSVMMDDDQLLYSGDQVRMATLRAMSHVGVQMVRVTVLWNIIAHGTKDPRTHHRFDPTVPRAYPRGAWLPYDQLVQDAAKVGILVYFDVTGPGPPWAMGKTPNKAIAKAFMPDPTQFGKFVQAVGTRYSGNYPNGVGKLNNLPRMSAWSIWNEPNWPTWLAPQNVYDPKLHQVLPYSPILYRRLYLAARRGLDRSGHTNDFVMLGETQPLGLAPNQDSTPMRPGEFIRELFCVGHNLRPLHGLAASERSCGDFAQHGAFRFTAWAHHPYTKAAPPTWTDRSSDSITLGDIARLPKLLDGIAASTHRLPSNLPIMVTEMGYSTNPPNPFRGVPLATQAAYINESDYMAYKQPRVISMTQFEFRDSPPVKKAKRGSRAYWATFQTGIAYQSGTPKPSYAAYEFPFWVHSGQDSQGNAQVELWAQVRFRHNPTACDPTTGAPCDAVAFQWLPNGSQEWQTITSPNAIAATAGFVDIALPAAQYETGGQFRALWAGPVPPTVAVSRSVAFP